MMRLRACGVFLLLTMAALACTDTTSPGDGTFQVIVADTVRTASDMQITIRNSTPSVVALNWCNVTFERELAPGVWPAPEPPQSYCIAIDLPPGFQETYTRTAPLPGRYRYVYPYFVAGRGDTLKAYSNTFVAVP